MKTKTTVASVLNDLCLSTKSLQPLDLILIQSDLVGTGLYRIRRKLPGQLFFLDYWQSGTFNCVGVFAERTLAGQKVFHDGKWKVLLYQTSWIS